LLGLLIVWIANLNYLHEPGIDCNVMKIFIVIMGSELCTHRSSPSFAC